MSVGHIMTKIGGKNFCSFPVSPLKTNNKGIVCCNSRPGESSVIHDKTIIVIHNQLLPVLSNFTIAYKFGIIITIYIMLRSFCGNIIPPVIGI